MRGVGGGLGRHKGSAEISPALLVIFALASVSGAPGSRSNTSSSIYAHVEARPFFDEVSSNEIEALEGQTLIVPCTVRNLKDKVVSWIRTRDLHILTSGRHAFSSDYRYEPVNSYASRDFWGLRIRGVKRNDAGQYECQVNTDPKMSLAFKLSVSVSAGVDAPDSSKWLGKATVKGPREIFVQSGSSVTLVCDITPTMDHSFLFQKPPKSNVWWLHEDTQIINQGRESKTSIESIYNNDDSTIRSRLTLSYVTWSDGGTYTCLQPSVKRDSVKLIIVEAETSEAMQRDFPVPSDSSRQFACLKFSIITFLIKKVYLELMW